MEREKKKRDARNRVGRFEMNIQFVEHTPESKKRWERREDALFAWLLEQWEIEHREAAA